MLIKDFSFQELPFSDLFKTYVSDFEKLTSFYETNPFSETDIESRISSFDFSNDRSTSISLLRRINKTYNVHEEALKNLDRLKEKDALAIVTGQQLGVYSGPLYTILKTISTIHLANKIEKKTGKPVVPVFWLADEDHDYEEIRSIAVINGDNPQTFSLPAKNGALPPVAEMQYSSAINKLKEEVKEAQFNTDFTDKLWEVLDRNFAEGKRFDHAFGGFIADLFSKHGLVIAGSNHPEIKQMTRECMKSAIAQADKIRTALQEQTDAISKKFSQQVTLYDSNLFYLDEDSGRVKISRNGDGWKTDSGQEWTSDELIAEIDETPELFSPNVFLRPVMQDQMLPTLGYVAGPGEIAYYGQMKTFYHQFDMKMPVIFPRLSATLIEPAIDRIMGEVPFEMQEFGQRIEDLESQFVERTEQTDIEAVFDSWQGNIESVSEKPISNIAQIDPTLEAAAEKAHQVFSNELDKLKGKVYRSVKAQEETQLKRIRRIQNHLFPNRTLQERTISGIYFMNKYGNDIWDRVLDSLDSEDDFANHKLIYL
ncbi:MAG: bacillithiol biosynthesis cysteine-adding enzyme BshC [Balneolaceae bacterium]|nr:bacillithiol biosynthesis cysteine-adding enzyme BshC [Balneolaceae bacterium]